MPLDWYQLWKELIWSQDTSSQEVDVKPLEKRVKFDKIVKVILIPSKEEYSSIKHDLWCGF